MNTFRNLLTMLLIVALLIATVAAAEELDVVEENQEEEFIIESLESEDGIDESAWLDAHAYVGTLTDEIEKRRELSVDTITEEEEQTILPSKTVAPNSYCPHKDIHMECGELTWDRVAVKTDGQFRHINTYRLSGSYELWCGDCDETIATVNFTKPLYMQEKELCSFNFITREKKCRTCKQKKAICKHKERRTADRLYGYEDFNEPSDCLYFDNNRHVTRVLVSGLIQEADDEEDIQELVTKFHICKTCGAFGTEDIWDGVSDGIDWWTGSGEAWAEITLTMDCDERYEFQSHNYVNGICTGCGHIKSLPSVKLSTTALTLAVKEKFTLPSQIIPSGVTFTSSNKKIATVNAQTGLVTAKKKGTATIKAVYNGIELANCIVTVKNAPSKVSLNKSKVTINADATYQLTAKIPSGTYTSGYTWSSSNNNVATVNANGLVTAVSKGTAKITVKTANGKKATCKVTVTMPKVSQASRNALVGEWTMYEVNKKTKAVNSFPVKITSVNDSGSVSVKWGKKQKKATGTWDEKRQTLKVLSNQVYIMKDGVLGGGNGSYSGIAFKKNDKRIGTSVTLTGKWRMTEHRKDANNDVIQFDVEIISVNGDKATIAWGSKGNQITGQWDSAKQMLTVYNGQTYLLRNGVLAGGNGTYSGVAYKTGN